jgi:hypothetical protein
MKKYGDGGIALSFLTSAPDGVSGQLYAAAVLLSGKEQSAPTAQKDRSGLTAGMDPEGKRKSLAPAKNRTPAVQPLARRYTD